MDQLNTKFLFQWFQLVWNEGRRDFIDALMEPDAIIHNVTSEESGGEGSGIEDFKKFYDDFNKQFSNICIIVEDIISEDDRETARCRVTAVNRASNEKILICGVSTVRLKDGKIMEAWNHFQSMALQDLINPDNE